MSDIDKEIEYNELIKKIPISVHVATILIFISYYLSVVYFSVYKYIENKELISSLILIIIVVIIVTVFSLIPFFIRRGKNTARILYLVLIGPALFFNIFNFSKIFKMHFILIIIICTQFILHLISFILLLIPVTNKWFKELKKVNKNAVID